MNMGKLIFLVDLARLRFGVQDKIDRRLDGKVYVYFYPLGNWRQANLIGKPDVIILKDNSMVREGIGRLSPKDGAFDSYTIILADEQGECPFLEGYLNSQVPELLREMTKIREEREIERSFLDGEREDLKRGKSEIVAEAVQTRELIERKEREDDKRSRSRRRPSDLDDLFR